MCVLLTIITLGVLLFALAFVALDMACNWIKKL